MSETPSSPRVRMSREGAIAYVTVGTGEHHNALAAEDWNALCLIFAAMAKDDELAAVVVRGAGSTFSAGSDIRQWAEASPSQIDGSFAAMELAFQAVEHLPVPVVALVEGVAAGAGCQLALACDLLLLARSARIGMPIARLGILISPAFAARLMALAGPGMTRDLLYTGRLLSAEEANEIGLATRIIDDDKLDEETQVLIRSILEQPAAAVRAVKASVTTLLAPARKVAERTDDVAAVDYTDFTRGVRNFLGRIPDR